MHCLSQGRSSSCCTPFQKSHHLPATLHTCTQNSFCVLSKMHTHTSAEFQLVFFSHGLLVPGAWCLLPGAWCLVPVACCMLHVASQAKRECQQTAITRQYTPITLVLFRSSGHIHLTAASISSSRAYAQWVKSLLSQQVCVVKFRTQSSCQTQTAKSSLYLHACAGPAWLHGSLCGSDSLSQMLCDSVTLPTPSNCWSAAGSIYRTDTGATAARVSATACSSCLSACNGCMYEQ